MYDQIYTHLAEQAYMTYCNIRKSIIPVVLIALHIVFVFGESFAAPTVKLVANPDKTEVYAGSDPITVQAQASGSGLQFRWELVGPGKIEGTGTSVLYIIPDSLEKKSARSIVSVIVTDSTGKENTEALIFTILPDPNVQPAPVSSAPPEKSSSQKKMGTGTKVALGLGAAALLGGGIVLLTGNGDDNNDSNSSLTGTWAGTLLVNGIPANVLLNLTQNGNNVTGNGSIESLTFQVTGTSIHPAVSLTLSAFGFQPAYFNGNFADANTITGTLNGSGFNNDPLTLRRQ